MRDHIIRCFPQADLGEAPLLLGEEAVGVRRRQHRGAHRRRARRRRCRPHVRDGGGGLLEERQDLLEPGRPRKATAAGGAAVHGAAQGGGGPDRHEDLPRCLGGQGEVQALRRRRVRLRARRRQPLRLLAEQTVEGRVGLWRDEGALSFVTGMRCFYRDSPHERE